MLRSYMAINLWTAQCRFVWPLAASMTFDTTSLHVCQNTCSGHQCCSQRPHSLMLMKLLPHCVWTHDNKQKIHHVEHNRKQIQLSEEVWVWMRLSSAGVHADAHFAQTGSAHMRRCSGSDSGSGSGSGSSSGPSALFLYLTHLFQLLRLCCSPANLLTCPEILI